MPSSCFTTTFYYPNGDPNKFEVIHSLCPVFPRNVTQLETRNGDKYFYYYQVILCLKSNGSVYRWFTKPTLAQALQTGLKGKFYQFNSDGTVIGNYGNHPLVWEKSIEVDYIQGYRINGEFDVYTFTYLEPISCRVCNSNCAGGDYEDWQFCCRDCMVEYSRD
jgi:hypothetical protein